MISVHDCSMKMNIKEKNNIIGKKQYIHYYTLYFFYLYRMEILLDI